MNKRLIPILLADSGRLIKTRQFGKGTYIGDPINTTLMFNELAVDEISLLDISASKLGRGPNLMLLRSVASYCFVPLSYGGGIRNMQDADEVFKIGVEKVIVNTAFRNIDFVRQLSRKYGSQAVVGSIDYKETVSGSSEVWSHVLKSPIKGVEPLTAARTLEEHGAGEILLTSVDREGTWRGPDTELASQIANEVGIPLIYNGGVSDKEDLHALLSTPISAVGLGNTVLFQGEGQGVLVGFPESFRTLVTDFNSPSSARLDWNSN